jgi:beta-mannosidase
MVWQEFPLSSSGVDNCAPDDPAIIDKLCTIATDYIRRRGHHVCKLLWCGGNELFGEKDRTGGRPHDRSHPAMAALARVVEQEDPGTRFVPTSPSGPAFSADQKRFGEGLHHDTHGPWDWHDTWDALQAYWRGDDSLFRSEVGMPGASPVDVLERYRGTCDAWPANRDNPYWRHSAGWWIQWNDVPDAIRQLPAGEALPRFVEWSQRRQAEVLAIAAGACKSRFPRCGGFLVWMGHDCFPCPANTSIIDFLHRPKSAWHALREVFQNDPTEGG